MEGCESCTLSHSMDGHWFHVSVFLLKKVITKRRIVLDMQFPNQPLGVKWKVVKVVLCPTLLMDTGFKVQGSRFLYLSHDKLYRV